MLFTTLRKILEFFNGKKANSTSSANKSSKINERINRRHKKLQIKYTVIFSYHTHFFVFVKKNGRFT
jgi:hypothetical protein